MGKVHRVVRSATAMSNLFSNSAVGPGLRQSTNFLRATSNFFFFEHRLPSQYGVIMSGRPRSDLELTYI